MKANAFFYKMVKEFSKLVSPKSLRVYEKQINNQSSGEKLPENGRKE